MRSDNLKHFNDLVILSINNNLLQMYQSLLDNTKSSYLENAKVASAPLKVISNLEWQGTLSSTITKFWVARLAVCYSKAFNAGSCRTCVKGWSTTLHRDTRSFSYLMNIRSSHYWSLQSKKCKLDRRRSCSSNYDF